MFTPHSWMGENAATGSGNPIEIPVGVAPIVTGGVPKSPNHMIAGGY
jgi:hypothetical protein